MLHACFIFKLRAANEPLAVDDSHFEAFILLIRSNPDIPRIIVFSRAATFRGEISPRHSLAATAFSLYPLFPLKWRLTFNIIHKNRCDIVQYSFVTVFHLPAMLHMCRIFSNLLIVSQSLHLRSKQTVWKKNSTFIDVCDYFFQRLARMRIWPFKRQPLSLSSIVVQMSGGVSLHPGR